MAPPEGPERGFAATSRGDYAVLRHLNVARAICFGDEPTTTSGAVKGERDRLNVADAFNELWAAHVEERDALIAAAQDCRRLGVELAEALDVIAQWSVLTSWEPPQDFWDNMTESIEPALSKAREAGLLGE
jgi:ABC-type sulfate/molybdate transport systems ATPase subunit